MKTKLRNVTCRGGRNGGGRPPRTTLVDSGGRNAGINGGKIGRTWTFSTKHIYLKGLGKFFCL